MQACKQHRIPWCRRLLAPALQLRSTRAPPSLHNGVDGGPLLGAQLVGVEVGATRDLGSRKPRRRLAGSELLALASICQHMALPAWGMKRRADLHHSTGHLGRTSKAPAHAPLHRSRQAAALPITLIRLPDTSAPLHRHCRLPLPQPLTCPSAMSSSMWYCPLLATICVACWMAGAKEVGPASLTQGASSL